MKIKNTMYTAAITLGVAATAGFYIQNKDQLMNRVTPVEEPLPVAAAPSQPKVILADPQPEPAAPAVPAPAVQTASLGPVALVNSSEPRDAVPVEQGEQVAAVTEELAPEPPTQVDLSSECAISLNTIRGAAAIVRLELSAPCHKEARVVISHEGLRFSELTAPDGTLFVDVPALAENAAFSVQFEDGQTASVQAKLPGMGLQSRAVLQWRGETGLALHAFEEGAEFGSEGHVWMENPGLPSRMLSGTGGFLMALGNPTTRDPLLAEIYSYPAGFEPELIVEAQITDGTCDQRIEGETLAHVPDQALGTVGFELDIPSCESVGDYLVLNNLYETRKIAQN